MARFLFDVDPLRCRRMDLIGLATREGMIVTTNALQIRLGKMKNLHFRCGPVHDHS